MSQAPLHSARRRIGFVSKLTGIGGPAGFQRRLASGLNQRGLEVGFGLATPPYLSVLVIGGTRRLAALAGVRRSGARIVQRLDGINWMHRRYRTGLRHYLRSEVNNLLMRLIRSRYADYVVYQSQFAREWWEREFGPTAVPSSVVHNGVPLDQYRPQGTGTVPADRIRLLMVEANYGGGYEHGLLVGYGLASELALQAGGQVELAVAGGGQAPSFMLATERGGMADLGDGPAELSVGGRRAPAKVTVDWRGQLEPEAVPELYRSAHLLFSADLNPACPNSVIEAMACGLPVVSFATGALPELVPDDSGRLAPFAGDPWSDEPQPSALVEPARQILQDLDRLSRGARARAEAAFGLDEMVDGYLAALAPEIDA